MIVLALDTATEAVTAGVLAKTDTGVDELARRVTVDARGHAENLTPNVIAALADSSLTVSDVDAVVVGCGPGPFTGLRVGMATAAAFGHALDLPVFGVCSLDAIGVETRGEVVVVTDARRRELYWARYRDGVRVAGPAVTAPADVPADERVTHLDMAYPTPAGLVRAVVDWTEPAPLVPMYLRRPDAKPSAQREPVTFDALTDADATRCAELEAQLFDGDGPWPASAFRAELKSRHHHYVAARAGDTLVGYAGVAQLGLAPPHEFEVHTIGVDPAYQGQGIGRRLLDELLAFAGTAAVILLEVRTDNVAAIAMYRSAGFVEAGLRKRYYRSGADAYTMRKSP